MPVKTFRKLISVEEAIDLMDRRIRPIEQEEIVSIEEALGRVLAQDVVATSDVPRHDRAAMDGYAVRAADVVGATTHKPVRLRLVGSVNIGEMPACEVSEGECVSISTGCVVPKGADSVVMHETTEGEVDSIRVYRPVYAGENVSAKGSDIREGSVPLRPWDLITPARVGVLASLGLASVRVFRKPRVAIIPTGPEIVKIGSPIDQAKVYDINSHALAAVVRENGGTPELFDPVPDERDDIAKAVGASLIYDLVVIAGGSSVGERDILYDVLSQRGEILFHGVQIKPGKPTLCAQVGDRLILGMPGHPTSCLSNAYLFLAPMIRKMASLSSKQFTTVRAKLSRRVVATLGRKTFLTVRVKGDEAEPAFKESSAITSMAEADGYIVIPENVDTLEKGDEVVVYLFH